MAAAALPAPAAPSSPRDSCNCPSAAGAGVLRDTLAYGLTALVDFAVSDVRRRLRQIAVDGTDAERLASDDNHRQVILTACASAATVKVEWYGAGIDRPSLRLLSEAWHAARASAAEPPAENAVPSSPPSPVAASSVTPASLGAALGAVTERCELLLAAPHLTVANHVVLAASTDPAPEEVPGVPGVWSPGAAAAVSIRISSPLRRFVTRRALHAAAQRQLPGVTVSVRLRPPPPVKSAGLVFCRAAAGGKPATPNPFQRRPLGPRPTQPSRPRRLAYELCQESAPPPPPPPPQHQQLQQLQHQTECTEVQVRVPADDGRQLLLVNGDVGEWPTTPLLWVGARRRTRAAAARMRQLADDAKLARELQHEFDGVAEMLDAQSSGVDVRCSICQQRIPFDGTCSQMYLCDDCGTHTCGRCFSGWCEKHATSGKATMSSIPCPGSSSTSCAAFVPHGDLHNALGDETKRVLAANDVAAATAGDDSFVRCPNAGCQVIVQRDDSALQAALVALRATAASGGTVAVDGEQWELRHAAHHLRYRLRCRECSTEFCSSCGMTPYHRKKDCEEARCPQTCRFCSGPLPAVPPPPLPWWRRRRQRRKMLVCEDAECCSRAADCCTSTLPCGHACNGVLGESTCLPCLHPGCSAHTPNTPEGDDLCSICWTDSLFGAPCVQLSCGHIVHFRCAVQKLENGWPTSRITFHFLKCSVCGQDAEHSHPKLAKLIEGHQKLRKELQSRWHDRLRIEGLLNSPELTNESSMFFAKPLEFAARVLSYYQCFRCKRPYFGGVVRCDAQNVGDEREFKKEELVCGACVAQTTCPQHGSDFVQFKCRYCCSLAVWFCWGTTHFCDRCHRVLPRPTPKCGGKDTCPLRISHPPNGQEHALGCMMCLAEKEARTQPAP